MLSWIVENTTVACLLAVVALGATVFYRSRPALCHLLWVIVLIRLVMPPIAVPGWPPRELKSAVTSAIEIALPSIEEVPTALPPSVQSAPASAALAEEIGVWDEGEDYQAMKRDPWWGWQTAQLGVEQAKKEEMKEKAGAADTTSPPARAGQGAWTDFAWTAYLLFLAVWALGSVWFFGIWVVRTMRFRSAIARTSPPPTRLALAVESVSQELGLKPPRIRMNGPTGSPSLWCFGKPLLLWPDSMLNASEDIIRPVIAHELSHLRRRDHWTAWLEVAAMIVLWWHPLVWIARRQLRLYAELACDARVISSMPTQRRHYAESLLTAASGGFVQQPPAALAAVDANRKTFEQRVRLIMQGRMSDHLSLASVYAIVVVTLVVAPSWAGSVGSWWFPSTEVESSFRAAVVEEMTSLRADRYYRNGTWRESAAAYAKVVKGEPTNGAAQHRLGVSLMGDDKPCEALEAFDAQVAADYQVAGAHFERARALAALDREDDAAEALGEALVHGFDGADRLKSDPWLKTLVGNHSKARVFATDLSKTHQLLVKAERDLEKSDWSSARKRLRAAAAASPKSGRVQSKLAFAAEKAEQFAEAEAALWRQRKLGHEQAEAMFNIARVRAREERIESAIDALEDAVRLGFSDGERMAKDPWLEPVRCHAKFGELLRRVHEPQRLRELVHRALRSESYEAAASAADKLLEYGRLLDNQQLGVAHHAKGMALLGLGQPEEASQEFEKQIELGFWLTEGLYRIACCRSSQGKAAEALAYLSAAVDAGMYGGGELRREPMLSRISGSARFDYIFDQANDNRTLLGMFMAADWSHLKQVNEIAIGKDKTDGRAHLRLGWALLRLGEYEAAAEIFKEQNRLDYAPQIARYNVACAYALQDDQNQAMNWLHAATVAGWRDFAFALEDPDLVNLRDNPDFQRMCGGSAE